MFAKRLQKWAKENTQLFACVMRHCVGADHLFDILISKMVVSTRNLSIELALQRDWTRGLVHGVGGSVVTCVLLL